MKLLTSDEEVSLPSPLGQKFFIHQLEVNASVYLDNKYFCLIVHAGKKGCIFMETHTYVSSWRGLSDVLVFLNFIGSSIQEQL